ncbi:hypothetical protein EDC04DRAFT_2901629 [Pisolithus marmoratus]|nr:hypothetical protein EDC04DRAFT_2901629 [Pisolithus marmoratus]
MDNHHQHSSDDEVQLDELANPPEDGTRVDEGAHDAPFDAAELPQQFDTPDGYGQHDVHMGLYDHDLALGQDHLAKFKASPVKHIPFSQLCALHDQKQPLTAIALLRRRHKVTLDDKYCLNVNSPNMVARVNPHYLDYIVKLQLHRANRLWPGSRLQALPFDPNGRMMFLGKRLDEELWLAMAPNAYFNVDDPENIPERLPTLEAKTSALSTTHMLMIIMFIAHVLDSMRHEDINCLDPYPEPLTRTTVKQSTEVL